MTYNSYVFLAYTLPKRSGLISKTNGVLCSHWTVGSKNCGINSLWIFSACSGCRSSYNRWLTTCGWSAARWKNVLSARRQLRQSCTLLTAYNFYVTILHITTATTESESLDKGLEYVQIYFSLGEDGTSFPKKNMCRLSWSFHSCRKDPIYSTEIIVQFKEYQE